jgi:hypothetical protein
MNGVQGAVVVSELARNNTVFWDYAQYLYDQQVHHTTHDTRHTTHDTRHTTHDTNNDTTRHTTKQIGQGTQNLTSSARAFVGQLGR